MHSKPKGRLVLGFCLLACLGLIAAGCGGGSGGDAQAPTAPADLTATAVSSSQIDLAWTASTDNVGVTGYRIFRDGAQVGTSTGTTYSDTGLAAETTYSYYVKAYDAANNLSAQSDPAEATTQADTKKICLIHYYEATAVANFAAFLEGEGYEVDIKNLPFPAALTTGLTGYDLFIIDPSTGQWTGQGTTDTASAILATGTPVLGIGQAGLKFFDHISPQIDLRYDNGGHFGFCYRAYVVDATDPLWEGLTVTNGNTVTFYTDGTTNGAGVPAAGLGAGVEQYATWTLDYPDSPANCAVLAKCGRFFAWGFYGRPDGMTAAGQTVFKNVVAMMLEAD